MTDSITRRDAGSCRLPGDESDHDDERRTESKSAGQSEKGRQACGLDVDWDQMASHGPPTRIGPPPPKPAAPAAPPAPAQATTAPKQATNNATRTSERDRASGPYASAGYAPGGHAVYAGVAIVKGRDANGGQLEAMSASVQIGAETEAQGTAFRAGFADGKVSIGGEVGTASAHVGIHNADGSTGYNIGAVAVGGSVEGTVSGQANSATVGLGYGGGVEMSVGLRDKDHNGQPEACFHLGVSFVTAGACIELPFHGKM